MDYIQRIFNKPWLVALLVGTAIHGSMELGAFLLLGHSYLRSLQENLTYGMIRFIVPYLIPFIIASISRYLVNLSVRRNMEMFPEANPDMILRLDGDGNRIYTNPMTREFLDKFKLPEAELTAQLYALARENGRENRERLYTIPFHDHTLTVNYQFHADSQEYFFSIRDVTRLQASYREIEESRNRILALTGHIDHIFAAFHQKSFNLEKTYSTTLQEILCDQGGGHDKPVAILLAHRGQDNILRGNIYQRRKGKLSVSQELTIDPRKRTYAILMGEREVYWENWNKFNNSHESFMAQFHRDVRKIIPDFTGYATYTSSDISALGFFRRTVVNENHAVVLKTITIIAKVLNLISEQVDSTREAFRYAVRALARAAEVNDEDTGDHILRVNDYSRLLAQKLGLDSQFIDEIHYSAQMHDVGKIHIHPDVLRKKGKLTGEEIAVMKRHPLIGARILGNQPALTMAHNIALYHHERYDGTGYPHGVAGRDIPLEARIVAIGDVYDALRQERSYKKAFSHDEAVAIIRDGDGRVMPEHFDPDIWQLFTEFHGEFETIFDTYRPTD
ncbi:MAG: HD-GYP domain-containing protein [Fidelibacterota bacterium]